MTEKPSKAVLALGANLDFGEGGPELALRQSLDALADEGVVIRKVSRFFATPCFPAGAGPDYVNAAALVETDLTPHTLLDLLHRVEHQFGRARVQRWGMRTLDLDVVCWEDLVLPDRAEHDRWRNLPPAEQIRATPEQLILPHPRLQDRAFVLVPMADVAPDWRHPVLGRTVRQMLAELPVGEVAAVKPL
ncbi:2-amino-4-hydroxy-6-hydroxymethyldihydropteridine diphosphokinase [Ruegeria sediminis]|uniref:2-amino-4-hydroxy-6-hydroxymethyldihydropteridine pyrophosphokinase n=1 Tax=Ruegeria sediminis TaxID=2583820 RepID=A0ABY2WTI9_9RHOB|nr:2-amino-4-hydroxy-6-hydroxymethyldihydropteridine diphosphokinase [Ruegeria sediminis]TMV03717.1 2-amino-4-hydroxy-6-hydroxymethyldihydropteridine diphosphokinase [Ruegeria sediminis]